MEERKTASIQCGNCNNSLENGNRIATLPFGEDFTEEVLICDAIAFIYGIPPKDLTIILTKYSEGHSNDNDRKPLNSKDDLLLCDFCAPLLSENYKTHLKFENASHPSSFVGQVKKFRNGEAEIGKSHYLSNPLEPEPEPNGENKDCNDKQDSIFEDFYFDDGEENEYQSKCHFEFENEEKYTPVEESSLLPKKALIVKEKTKFPEKRDTKEAVVKLEKLSYDELKRNGITASAYNKRKNSGKSEVRSQSGLNREHLEDIEEEEYTNSAKCTKRKSGRGRGINPSIKCDLCDELLPSLKDLLKHAKEMHPKKIEEGEEKEKTACNICDKLMSSKSLRSHMKLNHSGPRETFSCDKCEKSYSQMKTLKYHLATHSEQFVPFLCTLCGKAFNTRISLLAHEKIHKDEKKYSCDICSKSFLFKTYLRTHKYCHATERQFVCDLCGISFKFPKHLRKHLKLHKEIDEKGEKCTKCDECGKMFKHSLSLYKHKVRFHREDLKDKISECSVCRKKFSSRKSATLHEATHNKHQEIGSSGDPLDLEKGPTNQPISELNLNPHVFIPGEGDS